MAHLKITLVKGLVGPTERPRATVQTLGLPAIRQSVVRPDGPAVRGALSPGSHLVRAEAGSE